MQICLWVSAIGRACITGRGLPRDPCLPGVKGGAAARTRDEVLGEQMYLSQAFLIHTLVLVSVKFQLVKKHHLIVYGDEVGAHLWQRWPQGTW